MTDIIIRDTEIWEHCADCPMSGWAEVGYCLVSGRDISFYAVEGKPPDCKIQELHPWGNWEPHESGYLRCSLCHDVYIDPEWIKDGKWNFCPHCGAYMKGGNLGKRYVDKP